MTHPLEYHISVRPPTPASLALFAILSLPLLLVSSSPAQNNGASSAHAVTAPSSNSHVPANSRVPSTKTPGPSHTNNQPHPSNGPAYYYPFVYAVPVPYAVNIDDSGAPADNDPDYQGGPTVFDRRGSGPDSYIPSDPAPSNTDETQQDFASAASNSDPEPPADPTILVFKDGHQLEVANYAIVSQTLYDLTPGHPRKIALADLDLAATQKQNDDHGIPFDLPPSAQAN
jgi:hypothetical protein